MGKEIGASLIAEDAVLTLCSSYQGPKFTYFAQVYAYRFSGLGEI